MSATHQTVRRKVRPDKKYVLRPRVNKVPSLDSEFLYILRLYHGAMPARIIALIAAQG